MEYEGEFVCFQAWVVYLYLLQSVEYFVNSIKGYESTDDVECDPCYVACEEERIEKCMGPVL